MSNCINCAAPLPPASTVCNYCGTRNAVDFKQIHKHTVQAPETERICPRCDIPLQTINLKIEGRFLIEQCRKCFGHFFDPGELEALLDKSVTNVFEVNHARIENLKKYRRHDEFPVGYIKCPVCGKLMNRINYGAQSGIIVDKCKEHGVWLDGGELRQLMEWVKAGGQLLHHKSRMEQERMELERQKERMRYRAAAGGGYGFGDYGEGHRFKVPSYVDDGPDLLGLLSRFVSKLLG